jgi:Holliday junction resolvase
MGYRRRAGGGKRDDAEKPIVDALRDAGCEVWIVGGTGNPDVLVRRGGRRGRLYVAEIKTGKGTETKNQGAFDIWRTPEDALIAIGVIGRAL